MDVFEQLESYKAQLGYVQGVIVNHGTDLQNWELKEYKALEKKYKIEIARLLKYIQANNLKPKKYIKNPARKKTKEQAIQELKAAGVTFNEDFHALDNATVNLLVELAKQTGYKKPKTASGSTARYFFYHLEKLNDKKYIVNPTRKKTRVKKVRTPEKQYTDFHHKTGHKTYTDTINIPDKFIHIGKAVSLIYESDKFDGKPRLYKHDFKKHGNILAKPEGTNGFSDLILMTNLKFKIKKEGITG